MARTYDFDNLWLAWRRARRGGKRKSSHRPELNLRAERAKPYGLKSSPEGASLSQRGGFSSASFDSRRATARS